mgnify:FL=1|tara:strand:- start:911 stop:9325 length:8415 start_codon:yes stop_codon:yes gene_type:complete
MPEFKHGFNKARMNKDVDERLVPNGEYRDANNIQISTSEGSNVGVAQNLSGNIRHATIDHTSDAVYNIPTTATCVASIAAADKDKIYYFVCASDLNNAAGRPDICKDYILEYDTITEKTKYVFVDIWRVRTLVNGTPSETQVFKVDDDIADSPDNTTTQNRTGIRIGMHVTGGDNNYQVSDNIVVTDIRYNSGWEITVNQNISFSDNNAITFIAPGKNNGRVLSFSRDTLITGVNILDDFIYWTDNVHEPKKINIKRSIAGTGGVEYLIGGGVAGIAAANITNTSNTFDGDTDYFHTRLVREHESGSGLLVTVTNAAGNQAVYTDESHITVIRQAPTQPLELEMHRVNQGKLNSAGQSVAVECILHGFNWRTFNTSGPNEFTEADDPVRPLAPGEIVLFPQTSGVVQPSTINGVTIGPPTGNYIPILLDNGTHEGQSNPGDVPAFSGAPDGVCFEAGDVILFSRQEPGTNPPGDVQDYDIRARVLTGPCSGPDNPSLGSTSSPYVIEILSIKGGIHPLHDQNWYVRLEKQESLFEHKFPRFSYRYKYVDGEYSPFAPFSEIAFLPDRYSYEPKDGYNFGMVNQLRELTLKYYHYDEDCIPQDISEIDILYKETNNPAVFVVKTLKRSDQSPIWPDFQDDGDVFGRGEFKVTTDMIHAAVPSNQLLRPFDNVPRMALAQEISANRLIYGNYVQNFNVEKDPIVNVSLAPEETVNDFAMPSVKTLRTYQIGIVYSDRYGRETPIITGLDSNGRPNSITVNKPASRFRNRLRVNLSDQSYIPDWAEYMTYYVKETSTEYYNLASDRWYDAEDGNIWLSFPSSERNKVTEESFLELKKAHGSDEAVLEPARFKILAIENEAPTEVKSGRSPIGTLIDQDTVGTSTGFGYPTIGLNFILIDESQFDDIFPDIMDLDGRKSLVLRSPEGQSSREYFISSIVSTSPAMKKITLEDSFDVDIEFTAQLDGLTVNIFNIAEEHRPEYEGKFFAKIARNSITEAYLLSDVSEENIFLWGSFDLGYFNPGHYVKKPANDSLDSGFFDSGPVYDNYAQDFGQFESEFSLGSYWQDTWNIEGATDYTTAHPTEYSGNYGSGGQQQYFWGHYQNNSIVSDETQMLEGEYMLEYGPTWYLCSQSNIARINNHCDGTDSNNGPAFFIDAGPAYSWTSKAEDSGWLNDNYGNRPGCEYHDQYYWASSTSDAVLFGMPDIAGAVIGIGDAGSQAMQGNTSAGMGTVAGNMKIHKGQHSRGIWNGGTCMDIAWSGMGVGFDFNFGGVGSGDGWFGNFEESMPVAHKLSDFAMDPGMGENHENAWYFIQKLCTPGTRFRFKRDPRDLVDSLYTTTTFFSVDNYSYGNSTRWEDGVQETDGAWGIRNYMTTGQNADEAQYQGSNMRQRWTIHTTQPIGGDVEYGYSPIKGTNPEYVPIGGLGFRRALNHDFYPFDPDDYYGGALNFAEADRDTIEIYEYLDLYTAERGNFAENPAVWETIPPESIDLDVYYQASGLIPLYINDRTNEEYIPIRSTMVVPNSVSQAVFDTPLTFTVASWSNHNTIQLESNLTIDIPAGTVLTFRKRNSYECNAVVAATASSGQNLITIYGDISTENPSYRIHSQTQVLDWNNCWSFGNGVESDRIRDDFNADQVDNGVKVSTGIGERSKEERRKHGLIWSGIYNSNAGINDTNQFIAAESITKDLNPVYGSIQRILNRNTRLIMFCEDKILKAVTNRDALYNADGKPQLIASNAVIGDVQAYQGNYGISTNPESMAENPYAVYFSDAMRGKVLRLTTEGVVPISDKGMKDYFADIFRENTWRCLGTYDERKNEYNLTVSKKYVASQVVPHEEKTISYNDNNKGWVSFKSFLPQHGATLNNNYYTFYQGQIYKHHDETELVYYSSGASGADITLATVVGLETGMLVEGVGIVEGSTISSISANVVTISNAVTSLFVSQNLTFTTPHNTFYGTYYDSDITVVFNDSKSAVKSFGTINYEGTQARIDEWDSVSSNRLTNVYATNDGLVSSNIDDEEYYNLDPKNGWYIDNVTTDLQTCGNIFFKNKEGKYFGYPTGESTTLDNLDEREFSVQGLGNATMSHDTNGYGGQVTVRVTNNTSSTYQGSDGSGGVWDDAATIASETDKWEATIGSKVVTGGATIGSTGETLQFTLSPIVNGVYSGTPLAAENLEWSGANNVSGTSWTHDGTTNADPDDDNTIAGVSFMDDGVAGDPSNTITVTVTFANGDTYPTSDVLWYIDIDEKAAKPVVVDLRDVAFEVHWQHWNTDTLNDVTPDNITTPAIIETLVEAGDDSAPLGTSWEKWKFIGNNVIDPDQSTLVYSDTFSLTANNHFESVNYLKVGMGQYEPYYNVVLSYTYSSDNLITGFNVKVYYTSPGDIPDPPNNELYNLGHKILLRYEIKSTFSGLTDTITDVVHDHHTNWNAKSLPVRVYGNAGAKYKLNVEQKTSTTSATTDTNGYYSHYDGRFIGIHTQPEFTIPASGVYRHEISIPRVSAVATTSDIRYDVTITPCGTSTVTSNVPVVAGKSTITQHGWRKLTISPITFNSSLYQTMPADVVEYYPKAGSGWAPTRPKIITTTAGNGGINKNPIRVNRVHDQIKKGMLVVSEQPYDVTGVDGSVRSSGGTGTEPRITHGTTVSKVDGAYVYLSASHSLADESRIRFIENNKAVVPFSFQIQPNSNTLSITNATRLSDHIGTTPVSVLTNGAVNDSNTIVVDTIQGIKVGDRVYSPEITEEITVATLASATSITVSKNVTLSDDEKLIFRSKSSVELLNASKFVVGDDVFIRGHVLVHSLLDNTTVPILIDNIITAV